MTQTARRPSVEEIEQLREQIRRAPGSPAFVQLGEAYLALGRPRDAIDVAIQGLQANPQNLPGRLVLGRAYAMLHQWKEAQDELLRVVKTDRNHATGFLLLGEALLRRNDFERALPVLQHAQNLDPQAPGLDDLLKRARTGTPLGPPPPIPTPLEPLSQSNMGAPQGQPQYADPLAGFSDEPTRIAPTLMTDGSAPPPTAAPPPSPGPGGYPAAPQQGGQPAAQPPPPAPGGYPVASQPPPAASPPAPPAASPPAPPAAASATPAPAAASPGLPANVRPRLVPMQKPRDAARQPLRNAAAVGDYLNTLLTNGMLQVPEVQVRLEDFDTKRSKRWGRSIFRTFLFLFILLAAGVGGGGYWYYSTEQQRAADVARHLAEARESMEAATHVSLQDAVSSSRLAIERDRRNPRAIAVFARASSLSALLYGATPDELRQIDLALATARKTITEGTEGAGDVLFAQSALILAQLHAIEEAESQLADVRKNIDAWLQDHADDSWMRWLQGQAMLAAGNRSGAATAFEAAEGDGQGPVVATIARANMLLDEGALDAAEKRYDEALERVEDHPLALVNKALLDIERSGEPADIKGALSVRLADESGTRVDAYKALAMALVHYMIEDYEQFDENLAKATGVPEPRFLARVAQAHLIRGNVQAAGERRAEVAWHSKEKAEPHPLVMLFDAELMWLSGLPAQAIDKLGELKSVRAHLVRGRALYDLGKADEALAELDALLELAPNDWEGQTWRATVAMVARRGKVRREADSALAELGRKHKSKAVRYAHGTAYLRLGRTRDARRRFEQALEGVSESTPNPLAYRAHVALAEMDLAEERMASALEHTEKALEQNPGYLPAAGIQGRILVAQGEHEKAVASLVPVMEEPEVVTAAMELAYAEALVSRKGVNDEAREAAREAVRRAKDKGADSEELARVAPLVDEALVEELELKKR